MSDAKWLDQNSAIANGCDACKDVDGRPRLDAYTNIGSRATPGAEAEQVVEAIQ